MELTDMAGEHFDDAPQWYWAVSDSPGPDGVCRADDRFVVACGQRQLWTRVRREIDAKEHCSWMGFGSSDGTVTLADVFWLFITAREHYGASYNRVVLEMAALPAFAQFASKLPADLCNLVSNPISYDALPRERYDREVEADLRGRLSATLGIPLDR